MLPLERNKDLINDASLPYRELVGKLQYLVQSTRRRISLVQNAFCSIWVCYTKENFASAKRVLQYLGGTRSHGLVYRKSGAGSNLKICDYSDSDHANCPETSRSISGYVLRLNGWSFAFKSKKQKTVTDDTCKSEIVAASACVESLLWVHELLKEVGMEMGTPELRLDNQSTLKVCDNVGNYEGVKRYAKLSHKIAELVEGNKLTLHYVPTTENIADMFTKALGSQRLSMLRELLGSRTC
ncbi:polyprotein [Phytophthora megakarya]|uniref:Polyprotein n=1 Tax=Phytophthora megakarya TaxID=4795 RepID=A0A225UIM2_9STRA|nr:polyprotein [Phytophthora megakarya]